jgi:hypothetical protein
MKKRGDEVAPVPGEVRVVGKRPPVRGGLRARRRRTEEQRPRRVKPLGEELSAGRADARESEGRGVPSHPAARS